MIARGTARVLRVLLAAAVGVGCASSDASDPPADADPTSTTAGAPSAPEPRAPTTTPTPTPAPAPAPGPTAKTELVGGVLVLRTNVPAAVDACAKAPSASCTDADGDGLVDAWEALVLERMRPRIELDENEQIVEDAKGKIGIVARVTPRTTASAQPFVVLVYMILGYSKDYGSCGLTSHNGDNERVVLEVSVSGGDATVTRAYTAAHEYSGADDGHVYSGASLASELRFVEDKGEPRWLVLASRDKHATYANDATCAAHSSIPCLSESCSADGVSNPDAFRILAPFVNAGEPEKHLSDELTAVGFPGEHAWSTTTFCGGLGGSGCAGGNADKLTKDPFP